MTTERKKSILNKNVQCFLSQVIYIIKRNIGIFTTFISAASFIILESLAKIEFSAFMFN